MKDFFTYTTPEKAGISSKNVIKFITDLEHYGVNLHSFALIKGNEIFAEGYRKPFKKDEFHRMYSTSKTFVAFAIGVLAGEGKIKLSDSIIKYFPEYDIPSTPQFVKDATIEELLKMTTPFNNTSYGYRMPCQLEPDWVRTFFITEATHPAGTVFHYDTSGTYILNVIVERVTNMPFLEYLKSRVLSKIGFSTDARCLKAPEGYTWGGSAVLCTTLDLARLARIVMLDGKWDGEQLIPEDFVKAAITSQVDNNTTGFVNTFRGHGYGYQLWRTMDNTYSFLGMGDQLAICMPEEDLLFVCTADTQQGDPGSPRSTIFITLWKDIKELISKNPLPENKEDYEELKSFCNNLDYPVCAGNKTSPLESKIAGKRYKLNCNPMHISEVIFDFDNDGNGVMKYKNMENQVKYKELKFGIGKYIIDEFPQDGYFGEIIGRPSGKRYRCISSGAWTFDNTLHIKSDIIDEYFGNLSIMICFKNDEICIYMEPHAEFFLDEYKGFACGKVVS